MLKSILAGRPEARSEVDPPGVAVGVGLTVLLEQPERAAAIIIISAIPNMIVIFLDCMTTHLAS